MCLSVDYVPQDSPGTPFNCCAVMCSLVHLAFDVVMSHNDQNVPTQHDINRILPEYL